MFISSVSSTKSFFILGFKAYDYDLGLIQGYFKVLNENIPNKIY